MTKNILLTFLLLPTIVRAQSNAYFSGEAAVNFGRALNYTGYGLNVSGNVKLNERFYAGLSAGFVKLNPFTSQLAFPLSGRITFFTSDQQEKIAPFALFEGGKLLYSQKNFAGSPEKTMEGELNFFTGVGIKFITKNELRPFFAIGYAGYYFENKNFSSGTLAYVTPYRFRRVEVRLGITLPAVKKKKENDKDTRK